MTAVLAAAVAPLVPTRPLSASTTDAPARAAAIAAQAPAGPPPRTRTSAVRAKPSGFGRHALGCPVKDEVDLDERVAAEFGDANRRPRRDRLFIGEIAMVDVVEGIVVAPEMREVDADEHRIRQRIARPLDDRLEVAENLLGLRVDPIGKRRGGRSRIGWQLSRDIEPSVGLGRVMVLHATRRRRGVRRRSGV